MLSGIDNTVRGSDLTPQPSIRERAAEIARGGDLASARAFLDEHPAARTALEEELVRARQYGVIHQLSDAPRNVAQIQSTQSDATLTVAAPGGRQFHENEIALIQQNAPRFANHLAARTGQPFSVQDAERILAQTAYARINPGAPEPERPQFERAALDFLAGINPRTLLGADTTVPGAQQAFYFSSSPAQRTDSRIYANTLQSHASFYENNGLLRDPGGTAQRAETFERRMATAHALTVAAPFIASSLVVAPVAPTIVANAQYYVLTHPTAAMEGADLVGGFLLGDALPTATSLGPAAAAAIAARTEGNLLQRGGRVLSELFDTPARESVQRIRQSVAHAVEAGNAQRIREVANGTLADIKAQGRIGEAATRAFVEKQGYEVLGTLANRSNQGLDIVARAKDGHIVIIEVKGTTTSKRVAEKGLQSDALDNFDRIYDSAKAGKGRYANLTDESKPVLEALEQARAKGTSFDYRWAVVYLNEDRSVQGLVMDRWAQAVPTAR